MTIEEDDKAIRFLFEENSTLTFRDPEKSTSTTPLDVERVERALMLTELTPGWIWGYGDTETEDQTG